ncbi:uncharacterized protein LOC126989610 [Eriocheir sinensis]|uniref:uncharacterized protein LOC126989610 n=1 Tax=Eriocheir sinensis TaxID=95602 RepID=UPI0021C56C00|nr:uncharacterized protein LOC126989610 [Eriocheir sinensis]
MYKHPEAVHTPQSCSSYPSPTNAGNGETVLIAEVVESLFTPSLKEAGGLKHRGQVTTTSLQARDHKHLWKGLWNGRLHCGFTKINRTCKTCQALMSSVEEIGIPIMRETHNCTTPSPDASKLLPSCSRHTSREPPSSRTTTPEPSSSPASCMADCSGLIHAADEVQGSTPSMWRARHRRMSTRY